MRLKVRNTLMGLWVAAAAVSCSDEMVEDGQRPAGGNDTDMISFVVADNNTRGGSFGNRPGSSTRAEVTSTTSIKDPAKPFAVYGDMVSLDNSSNSIVLFNKEAVKYEKTADEKDSWTYSNLRYWFPNYNYSFTAIYPYPGESTPAIQKLNYSDNTLSFTYSPENYTQATDIITATHRRNSSVATTPVSFEFHHIFSRINFKAIVEPSAPKSIVIDRLTLVNVRTKAKYSITSASTGNITNDYTEAWQIPEGEEASTDNLCQFDVTESVSIAPGTTYEFFPNTNALMVIPQTVPDDTELQISYHMDGSDKISQASTKLKGITITAHQGVWLMGNAYTYSFTLGDNESIIFSVPNVQNWEEAEGGNYVITD